MAERSPQGGGAPFRRPRLAAPDAFRRLGRLPAWLACAAALACSTAPPPLPPAPGSVHGRLVQPREAAAPPSEPLLVFLEPLDPASARPQDAQSPVLRSGEEGLVPAVLAVSAGHSIRFANDTEIYHRIFSYSESNPFDLGVLRRGEARSIRLPNPGVVRIYCSLHPAERATVFVVPFPYFATFRPPAAYEIRDVPPGRYRLHAWGEGAPAASQPVTVLSGISVAAELAGGPAARE